MERWREVVEEVGFRKIDGIKKQPPKRGGKTIHFFFSFGGVNVKKLRNN